MNSFHGGASASALSTYHSPGGNSFSSSMAASPDSSHPPVSPQYMQELLKDKRNLQNFPNVFHHLDRILESEISRARSNLYHQNGGSTIRQLLGDLPEGEGPMVTVQEKVYVPVKDNPNYNFVGRLLGPRGMTAKQLESDLDCKIMIRGKGSMRDKKKEEQHRGKPNWEHLSDELHVLISVEDCQNRAEAKAKRAAEEIRIFLEQAVKMPSSEDSLKRKQLIEVAMINGTYRDTSASAGKAPLPPAGSRGGFPCGQRVTFPFAFHHQLQTTRASNAAAALSAAAAAAASLPPGFAAAQASLPPAAFLRMPGAGGLTPQHFLLPAGGHQHQAQQQQLLGFPLMQANPCAAPADFSSFLLAAAAAAAAASTSSAGAGASQAATGGGADPAAAMMAALMYQQGGLDIFSGGQSGPMKSRQGASGLRTHPYSRPTF